MGAPAGYGAWGSINDLPRELLEGILWQVRKASEAASCGSVCKLWGEIIRRCLALELEFDAQKHGIGIPRIEEIIGGVLANRSGLRELFIVVKQSEADTETLSEIRIIEWLLPLAAGLEVLVIHLRGLNLCNLLKMPHLRKLLVSRSTLGRIPRPLPAGAGENLKLCSLDFVIFQAPLSELLLACPCLESLILSSCEIPGAGGEAIAIASPSLLRLFISNISFVWIALDAPKLEIVGIGLTSGLRLSGSPGTRIRCLILKEVILLECAVEEIHLTGSYWSYLPETRELLPLAHKTALHTLSTEAGEEMQAWLEKSGSFKKN